MVIFKNKILKRLFKDYMASITSGEMADCDFQDFQKVRG
jgi:hypothetical protein